MTSPIDVAYVEILPDTKVFHAKVKKDIDRDLKTVEESASDTADKISGVFRRTGTSVDGAFKDVGERLSAASGKIAADVGSSVGDAITTGFRTARGAADSFVGALASIPGILGQIAATGPVGIALLVAGFVLLAAVATAAAAAIQALITITAAGLAALPGLLAGVIAGFGVLAVALNGIIDAFKEQTDGAKKAGAAGANSARQIADAQRGLLQAQKDVIKARDDEIKRIRTIAIELNRARVTEARAIDNVKNAELALRDARALNSPRAVTEAQLQLDEAQASLLEAKDRTKNLAAEKAKADKNGVAGSEQVLRAQEALIDAQDRLAASQRGFAAATAASNTAFSGLAASAQAFVLALVSAKKELGPIADAIQGAFFQGTAPLIDPIVENIKAIEPQLVRVAAGFNKIFAGLLKFLGSDEGQKMLDSLLGGLADFLETAGPGLGALAKAFAGLVGDSGEFGDNLGGVVSEAFKKFADFIKNVDLKKLFEDAKKAIAEIMPVVKPFLALVRDLFKILVAIGKITLPQLGAAFEILGGIIGGFERVITPVFDFLDRFFDALKKDPKEAVDLVVATLKGLPEKITALGPRLLEAGKSLISQLFGGLGKIGGFVEDLSKRIANSLIGFVNRTVINGLNKSIQTIQDTLNKAPFFDLDLPKIPNIPQLAKGGLATKNMIANIGEGNKEEAVLPLENPSVMRRVGEAVANAGGTGPVGGTGDVYVTVLLGNDQLVPHTVRVVRASNRRVARSVKQVPRMV